MENTMSVNGLNGWKAAAASNNRESFINVFGRKPEQGEVESWVSSIQKASEVNIERSFEENLVKIGEGQWRWERIL